MPYKIIFFLADKPKVTVIRQATDVLEEGKGSISMTCSAAANPPARVFWRKYDGTDENQFVETLEFNPVRLKLNVSSAWPEPIY